MVAASLLLALAATTATASARPFAEERVLLDRRLETLRRILPDGPSAAADVLLVRDAAEAVRLARVEIQPRPLVESGARGEVVLELTALGDYEQLDRFFQRLAVSHRLVDVESVTLTATSEDQIQLASVLRLPFWPLRAPLPQPPESRSRPSGVPRPLVEAFLRDQALAFGKSDAIAGWRRARRNPRLFLSELSAVARERPVVLGYAALAGGEFTVRGLALGEGPVHAFESRLERGFLRVADFLMAKQGACHRFEARGTCPVAGPDAQLPVPVEDPFEQDVQPCRVDRDAARQLVVKGRTPTAKDPGRGPLTLRLRDVDLSDVFQVLAVLGAGGYVVDAEVVGRVSVELTRATLDETLAALHKGAGVEIAGSGAVRRVATSRLPLPTLAGAGGPAASFALKRAEVRDVLAAMAEVDPQLAALGPSGFLGRASVWTKDAPLGEVRAALLESAGLHERIEEERRVLEGKNATLEAPVPVARTDPEPRLALRREELSVLEFQLSGVASSGDAFVAFAYSPTGQLFAYRAGDRIADAQVRSVESTDVLLETDEGPLRIALPPLPD